MNKKMTPGLNTAALEMSGSGGLGGEAADYGYRRDVRTALPQIIAVCIKNLLLLGYGMALGFPTILIPAMVNPAEGEKLKLVQSEISWISSMNLIVVPVGCALSGVVTTPLGRRRAMQAVNLPFLAAWLLFHFATTTGHLYAALFLVGLAGGLLEAPVLTYVAEITQPYLRGSLSATSSMSIIVGVFTQFLLGLMLAWRTVALVNISVTVITVISLFFVPESPHWLVSRNRVEEACKSLQWLRGWTTPAAVQVELEDIKKLYKKNEEKGGLAKQWSVIKKLRQYCDRGFLVPFWLVSFTFFVGHFSGMTTLQTYAVSIFERVEAPLDAYRAALVLGALQTAGAGGCVALVPRAGKRPLALLSTAAAALCCLLLAAYDRYLRPVQPVPSIPTTLLLVLAFMTHLGIRLLPWILIGEVFSSNTRSGGAGMASGVGYLFGFMANKMYLSMVDTLSIWGTYGIYGLVSLTGCVVMYFILPETEGKRLSEIEDHFAGHIKLDNKVARSRSQAQPDGLKKQPRELKGVANQTFQMEDAT